MTDLVRARAELALKNRKRLGELAERAIAYSTHRPGGLVPIRLGIVNHKIKQEEFRAIVEAPIRNRREVLRTALLRVARDAKIPDSELKNWTACAKDVGRVDFTTDGYDWHCIELLQRIIYVPSTPRTLGERLQQRWLKSEGLPKGLFGIEIEFATEATVEKRIVKTGTGVCDYGPDCCPPICEGTEVTLEVQNPPVAYRDIQAMVPGLKMKTDSSVHPHHSDAQEAAMLLGPHGFNRLKKVCALIKERGGSVNKTCGLHVHLDVRGEDRRVIGIRAAKLWDAMGFLTDLVPAHRFAGTYCVLEKPAFEAPRYRAINLQSVRTHGTIEVRIGSGSLNPGKIWSWANLLARISNYKGRLKSWEEFMSSSIPLPLKVWAANRAMEIVPDEKKRVERLDMIAPGFSEVLAMKYERDETLV